MNYLKKHPPRVDASWIGIVGFCMGSRIVYLMSAVNADFVKFV